MANAILLVFLFATCWVVESPAAVLRLFAAEGFDFCFAHRSKGASTTAQSLLLLFSSASSLSVVRCAWNLVSGSMWWDEAWALQNVYLGEFERSRPDLIRFARSSGGKKHPF